MVIANLAASPRAAELLRYPPMRTASGQELSHGTSGGRLTAFRAGLALALTAAGLAGAAPAAIVHEISQGSTGTKEWVEILVVEDGTDLRGWELGDNDDGAWHAICTFRDTPVWSQVAAGTLIVVYNAGDRDTLLPADAADPTNRVLVVGSGHTALLADAANGWPDSGVFGNDDPDDAPALRDATGTLVHDMAVTHPTATVGAPASQGSRGYTGNTTARLADPSAWALASAANATPGAANGPDNALWLAQLRGQGLPTLRWTETQLALAEGAPARVLQVVLSAPAAVTAEVAVAAGGSATGAGDGRDFTFATNRLVFTPPATTQTLALVARDDDRAEPPEHVALVLSNVVGAVLAATGSTLNVTFADNEPPTLLFRDATAEAYEPGGFADLPVHRWGVTNAPAACGWRTEGETARGDADYPTATGLVAFAAGQTTAVIRVALTDDDAGESNETFAVVLHAPAPGTTLGARGATQVRILDDENEAPNYYAGLAGLHGDALRGALHTLIRDHRRVDYNTAGVAAIVELDACPTNAAQVWLLYAETGRATESVWNREHIWPRSHGFPGTEYVSPPSQDLHNLRATDAAVNALRGELDFDAGGGPVPGTPPSCRSDADSFEPPDTAKGDVARAVFYMDLRYAGDRPDEPDLRVVESGNTSGPELGRLSQLVAWHFADPPDDFERRRNSLIQRRWQGNRNPFIDRPEWVLELWGPGIVTRTEGHGSILPANPRVTDGASVTFAVAAAPYHFLAGLRTNGVPVAVTNPAAQNVTWHGVTATGELAARFAPYLAGGVVPHAWLAAHNLPTNDAAATGDADHDGALTWEEYVADTAPTNPAERFLGIVALQPGPGGRPSLAVAPSHTNRYYRAICRPDWRDPRWQPATTWRRGSPGTTWLTPTNPAATGFFRSAVRTDPAS